MSSGQQNAFQRQSFDADLYGSFMLIAFIVVAGLWVGLKNSLVGGGWFITLPVLILSGMTPLAANIKSTVARFPGQVATVNGSPL